MDIELDNWEFTRMRIPPEPPRVEEPVEMVGCLWPFLRFFRIFGLCPVERSGSHLVAPHRIRSLGWGCSIALLIVHLTLLFNSYYRIRLNQRNVHNFFFLSAYFCHVVPTCWYMICRAGSLRDFVTSFREIEVLWRKYGPEKDDGLVGRCFKIFIFFEAQHILAMVFDYVVQVWQSGTFLDFLARANHPRLAEFGSYYTGAVLRLCQLFSEFGWNFIEVLMALMAVILTRYYVRFNVSLEKRRLMLEFDEIEELRADHQKLNMAVVLCNKTFWSLFFWLYVGNMAYVFGKFNLLAANWKYGGANAKTIIWVEILWRFFYQVGIRLLLSSFLASRLHEEAHKAIQTVQRWPSFNGKPSERNRLLLIRRFEDQLYWLQIGFKPRGFFLVTRPFMLSMLSALLANMVVILQLHTGE